jgi:hypothetical protein
MGGDARPTCGLPPAFSADGLEFTEVLMAALGRLQQLFGSSFPGFEVIAAAQSEAAHREAALFVPNALAAPFAFEKTNCLSLLRIEELKGELKGCRTRRAGRNRSRSRSRVSRLMFMRRRFYPTGR